MADLVGGVNTEEDLSLVKENYVDINNLSIKDDHELPLDNKEVQNRSDIQDKDESKSLVEDENKMGGPTFFPPLYIQRYSFVADILNKYEATNVSIYK